MALTRSSEFLYTELAPYWFGAPSMLPSRWFKAALNNGGFRSAYYGHLRDHPLLTFRSPLESSLSDPVPLREQLS
jgi:hypothetical protein